MSEVVIMDGDVPEIITGRHYLNWRFTFADEILVHVTNMGKVLLAKLPDGRLRMTQDQHIINSFTKVNPEFAKHFGRPKPL